MAVKKEEQKRSIEQVMNEINKMHGENTVGYLPKMKSSVMERISSGSLWMDYALGGGWPVGRIVELFGAFSSGKSLIATKTIVEAQKMGKKCVYIDAENSFDPSFAEKLGVDLDELVLVQSSIGETTVDILISLIEADVDLIVVDSVAALTPNSEMKDPMQQQTIGLHARLMSKALRKINAINKNCLVFFINQQREAVGCMSYASKIDIADEKTLYIGNIVNKKLQKTIYSYDEKEKIIVKKDIAQWHNNGQAKRTDWVKVNFRKPNGKGKFNTVACTKNHLIMTKNGWKRADKLSTNDFVAVRAQSVLTQQQLSVLYGSCIGDGGREQIAKNRPFPTFKFSHCSSQKEYLKYKHEILKEYATNIWYCGNDESRKCNFSLKPLPELLDFISNNTHKTSDYSKEFINSLDNVALSIWYQDDGTLRLSSKNHKGYAKFATQGLSEKTRQNIISMLSERFGSVHLCPDGEIYLHTKPSQYFFDAICKFIHPSMYYKLPEKYRGKFDRKILNQKSVKKDILIYMPVISVESWKNEKLHRMYNAKYDIGVDGTHSYFVNGLLVHNSFSSYGTPMTTTGGRALGFYSSIRVEVKRGEDIEENKKRIGQVIKFKVQKNKTSAPFRNGIIKFIYEDEAKANYYSFDVVDEMMSLAILLEIVEQRGAYFYYEDTSYRGKAELEAALRSDAALYEKIKRGVLNIKDDDSEKKTVKKVGKKKQSKQE